MDICFHCCCISFTPNPAVWWPARAIIKCLEILQASWSHVDSVNWPRQEYLDNRNWPMLQVRACVMAGRRGGPVGKCLTAHPWFYMSDLWPLPLIDLLHIQAQVLYCRTYIYSFEWQHWVILLPDEPCDFSTRYIRRYQTPAWLLWLKNLPLISRYENCLLLTFSKALIKIYL